MVADVQKGGDLLVFFFMDVFYSLLCSHLFTSFIGVRFFYFYFILLRVVAVLKTKSTFQADWCGGGGTFGVLVIISGCGILTNRGGEFFLSRVMYLI